MKTRILAIALLLSAGIASAQNLSTSGNITAQSSACSGAGAGIVNYKLPPNVASTAIALSGTWSATVQFVGSTNGSVWSSISATPLAGGSAVTSATANGTWTVVPGGAQYVCAYASSFSSGPIAIAMSSNIVNGPGTGVAQIIAGTNVTVTPTNGLGAVTVNASSSGSVTPSTTSPLNATYTLWTAGKLALAQTAGSSYTGTGTCTLTGGTIVSGTADTCTATQSGGAITFAIVGSAIYSTVPSLTFGGVSVGTGAWAQVYNDPANTTIYVRNEASGVVTSGTDLNPLMTAIFAANATVNLHFYFKNGVYPINSLTQSQNSGCTNYYSGVFIPSQAPGNWTQNIFEGESGTTNISEIPATQGLSTLQTNGVIWYVTSTAIGTVTSSNFVSVAWQDPGPGGSGCAFNVYSELANENSFKNIAFRLPSQRAHSAGSLMWAAENVEYRHDLADFFESYNAIATGSAPPADSFGMTSSFSFGGQNQNFYANSSVGWNVGYDWGENTNSVNDEAIYNNYPWEAGVKGQNQYHGMTIVHFTDQENANGPLLGSLMQPGSEVDASVYDIEYGASGWYARTTPGWTETNPGNSYGLITYSQVQSGGARLNGSYSFNTGGGNFCIIPAGNYAATCAAVTPAVLPTSILWLPINEGGTGTSTATDYSGNGNNGTWHGTKSCSSSYYSTGYVYTYAGCLNGTDNYLSASVPTVAAPFTINQWVNITAGGTNKILSIISDSNSNLVYLTQGTASIPRCVVSNASTSVFVQGPSIGTSSWHMLTCQISSTGQAILYEDGELIGASATLSVPWTAPITYSVGYNNSSFTSNMLSEDARVYAGLLTPFQIVSLYNAKPATLVGSLPGTLTYTTATSDVATVLGATSTSACTITPTNSTAAAATVAANISATGTNTVTVSHVATTANGGTVNILCKP